MLEHALFWFSSFVFLVFFFLYIRNVANTWQILGDDFVKNILKNTTNFQKLEN